MTVALKNKLAENVFIWYLDQLPPVSINMNKIVEQNVIGSMTIDLLTKFTQSINLNRQNLTFDCNHSFFHVRGCPVVIGINLCFFSRQVKEVHSTINLRTQILNSVFKCGHPTDV